jgi:hypothetical protein
MRTLTLALLIALLAAAPASADYRRLPGKIDWFTLGGGELFTAAGGKLTAYAPGGRARPISIPKGGRLDYVTASEGSLSVSLGPDREFFRAEGRPWKRAPGRYPTVRVSGHRATVLTRNAEDTAAAIRIFDLRTGASRRYAIREQRAGGGHVVGRYFAYIVNHAVSKRETVVVRSVATGREVYRVRAGTVVNFALLKRGRLIVVRLGRDEGSYRVTVATPARPRPRVVRELRLGSPQMGFAEDAIALVHGTPESSEVALLGFDRSLVPVTPPLRGLDHVVYDGRTLALEVGDCVFTGPAAWASPNTAGCIPSR